MAASRVLDFGLAHVVEAADERVGSRARLTEPGAMLGTPGYMPPEQLRGEEVDFRADIFSFGVMLFELVSGVLPFTSSTPVSTSASVLEATPPDLEQLRPSRSGSLTTPDHSLHGEGAGTAVWFNR